VPSHEKSSENIIVKRIVDRFLEHSRIFIFGNDDDAMVIMGSADWMTRNLHRRIEVCVPVEEAACKKELIDYFEMQWNDTDKAVQLNDLMQQVRPNQDGASRHNAQEDIYQYICHRP
jgi:polyphosphate kinase